MSTNVLTTEQRRHLFDATREVAGRLCFDDWKITDVVKASNISSVTVRANYPSKDTLLLDAVIHGGNAALDELTNDPKSSGRTPRSRVLRTLGVFTDLLVASPTRTRGILLVLSAGQEDLSSIMGPFRERFHMAIARSLAGGEPGDPEWAMSSVIVHVWFAAVVAWASGCAPVAHIEEAVVLALRMMKVNQ